MESDGIALKWRRIPNRYRLVGSHCENCGADFFPPRKICPNCGRKTKMVEKTFSGYGRIYSYTIVRTPTEEHKENAPYVLAIVQLDEGPKLTAQIIKSNNKEIKIGSRVKLAFRRITEDGKEGLIHYGYKFQVIE
jgi:uncharacterized OB-fold protein